MDDLIPEVKAKVGALISKPKMTESRLIRPPIRFLHDTISAIINKTGFAKGLYTDQEMDASSILVDRNTKMAYFEKIIKFVGIFQKAPIDICASKVVAGLRPEDTCRFLIALAECACQVSEVESQAALRRGSSSQLQRFVSFHGMLCTPCTAQECIADFTGTILFMPSNYKKKGIRHYQYPSINIWSYYGLVLASLTGLSTILGLTHILAVEENLISGLTCPEFENDPDILEVVVASNSSSSSSTAALHHISSSPHALPRTPAKMKAKIIRRFSYHFLLPMFRVQMFHVVTPATKSDDGDENQEEKLHLVEIFDSKNGLSVIYVLSGFLLASWFVSKRRLINA